MKRTFKLIALLVLVLPIAFAAANLRTCPTGITKDMSISYNDHVSCQLDTTGEVAFYRFQGVTGHRIMIAVFASYQVGPCVALYDPAGILVQENCSTAQVVANEFLLDSTGAYTIRVHDNGYNNIWTYTLYLERVNPFVSPTTISYGQQISARIDPSLETDQYVFAGTVGDSVALQMNVPHPIGPVLEVYKPSGDRFQYAAPGTYVNRLEFTLPETGTYRIRASDNGRDNTFDYALFLQCLGSCTGIPPVYPTATLALTGCTTCKVGDTFSARVATSKVSNGNAELKLGFYLPDNSQHSAGDSHLELPAGFSFDSEVLRFPITASHPKGNYRVCARILELAAGDILAASCQSFVVQ